MGSVVSVLPYIGVVFSIVGNCVPAVATFRTIRRQGSVGNRSPLSYLASLFNCGVWILNRASSAPLNRIGIFNNAVGAAFHEAYMVAFLCYSTNEASRCITILFLSVVAVYGAIIAWFYTGRTAYFPYFASASGACAPFIPFVNLRTVRATMTMESMPHVAVAGLGLLSSTVWLWHACLESDWYLAIAQGAAIVSTLLQLGLHCFFWVSWARGASGRRWLQEPLGGAAVPLLR